MIRQGNSPNHQHLLYIQRCHKCAILNNGKIMCWDIKKFKVPRSKDVLEDVKMYIARGRGVGDGGSDNEPKIIGRGDLFQWWGTPVQNDHRNEVWGVQDVQENVKMM